MSCNCFAIDSNVLSRLVTAVQKELAGVGTAGSSCCGETQNAEQPGRPCCTIKVCFCAGSDQAETSECRA